MIPGIKKLAQIAWSGLSSILPTIKKSNGGDTRLVANPQSHAERNMTALIEGKVTGGNITIENVNQITQVFDFQSSKRQNNVKSVIEETAKLVEGKDVPDTPIDHDWTARFFNYIQDVSSEDIQPLWSRILAGEVERPGSVSLQTLSILRDLDHKIAKRFEKLCSCSMFLCIPGKVYFDGRVCSLGKHAGNNALDQYGLGYAVLNSLSEYRLIKPELSSWIDYRGHVLTHTTIRGGERLMPLRFQKQYWVFSLIDPAVDIKDQIQIAGPALTKAGREIAHIVNPTLVPEYHTALTEYFAALNLKITSLGNDEELI